MCGLVTFPFSERLARVCQNCFRLTKKAFPVAQERDFIENDENLLKTMLTGDESWVDGYDSETKAQSPQWKILTSHVHHEYAPPGQIVSDEGCRNDLSCLKNAIRRKRAQLHASSEGKLHYDNALANSVQNMQLTRPNILW